VTRSPVDRFIDITERAAGLFLAAIATLVFVSVVLRGTLRIAIADWYDMSRLMLGVAIFWGIAATSYRNDHIKVDILWEWAPPRARFLIDLFATLVTLAFLAAFSWMLTAKVGSGFRSGEATFDMRLPIWPFHFVAALGIFLATVLVAIRLVRLFQGGAGHADDDRRIAPVE
jgi:TRAP-type C4-dicarboxylate transport system permease small subunit